MSSHLLVGALAFTLLCWFYREVTNSRDYRALLRELQRAVTILEKLSRDDRPNFRDNWFAETRRG